MAELEIRDLHVSAEGKEILKGLDLSVDRGQVHALMGPNGSGKSTLANAIMGHPALDVTEGEIIFQGEDITDAAPEERARAGLFMAFQYPVAVPGVTVAKGVNQLAGPEMGVLIITHYQRILHHVEPDFVHVMYDGRIVKQGGPELVTELEEKGYGWIRDEVAAV